MHRDAAIAHACAAFDAGAVFAALARRVARPTESQVESRAAELAAYLRDELVPTFTALGFACEIVAHDAARAPFLIAERREDPAAPTVFGYGHGDVVRGQEGRWQGGRSPWTLVEEAGRWYGRGVADNKGQHSVNLQALASVLATRGRLGFNAIYLVEMGEEIGSPGLAQLCAAWRDRFRADLMLASDGPRLSAERPTIFLGSRGCWSFDLVIEARDRGHHAGNWGGLLANPGIQLAHAVASIVGANGEIRIADWVPEGVPEGVRRALADCVVGGGSDPSPDLGWGEPGLSPAERVFGWSSFEVLAWTVGNPEAPVGAIPPRAWARCQLRYVAGTTPHRFLDALRRHLDRHGFPMVQIRGKTPECVATRADPEHPWVRWAAASMAATSGKRPAILPNLGGSLPNHIFADTLGLTTVWVPHSYPGCAQHAPDEHVPADLLREAVAIMTGLYWDLGGGATPALASHPGTAERSL